MSTQVPYPPASPPASHGGNLDPNEVRLRQQPATSPFPAYPAPGTSMPSSESSSHGGNMDPNATRLRLADMQQTSGSSEQVSLPRPYNAAPSSNMVASSPPPGSRTPPSAQSGQYIPTQYGQHFPNPGQAQISVKGNLGYPPQPAPGASYAKPSQNQPVGYSPPAKKKSALRRVHDFLMEQGSNERRR
ncbi:MAG: hypothetical protein Q9211_003443 [Gyalolechia sp. 1 TL-2023]